MIDLSKINNLSKRSKCYIINCFLCVAVLSSIALMFFVQFKVDNLQNRVNRIDTKIANLDDEIRVLEVEWVYLTRPERLRMLSKRYLDDNGYIAANRIKDINGLRSYYVAALKKRKDVAMNR